MSSSALAFMLTSILLIFTSTAITLSTLLKQGKKNDE